MTYNDIPKDLPIPEYTLIWKKKNLSHLKNIIFEIREIQSKSRKYKNFDTLLVANFMQNLTRTAEAIFTLSLNHFDAEIITLSGTMIEGISLMLYCLKNNKATNYFDYLIINALALEYVEAEAGVPSPKQIEVYVNILEEFENKYIKSGKNYTEVISFLKSDIHNYKDKLKTLREFYEAFPKRSVQSMIDEFFIKEKTPKAVYEKYCHIKHHHLNNNIHYPEFNYWKKEFSPFDELSAISTALIILKNVLTKYKEMKTQGYIEEKV